MNKSYVHGEVRDGDLKTAILIISGTKSNVGTILTINNEVTELFGYEKKELLGENVTKLMHPAIAAKHAQLVIQFLREGKKEQAKKRIEMPLHKFGFLVPCTFIHRIVPNLLDGLQLIGFFDKVKDFSEYYSFIDRNINPDEFLILLADQNMKLLAFNLKAASMFGINPFEANIKKYINAEEKIPIHKIIPEFEEKEVSKTSPMIDMEVQLDTKLMQKVIENEIEILTVASKQEISQGYNSPKNDREEMYCCN